ncbi:T9SS type A sorting domain-containing protein [Hymenobacter cellulosilyticus]|uniref:T9SS type A sorting domain-containing protein n=1 Tax=Hymenobacter cellulosilyticus TaxID=2932248 RepID=A0A8T9Q4M8_9BACT|nr:T9SS type A sorting domain-containing protein [Hymenobacter cellulosilyticus]UOQ72467.1 T9SS type A sorting domain-containing protein [Hymenobacter cellulosilyticus]
MVSGSMSARTALATAAPTASGATKAQAELQLFPNPTTADRIELVLQTASEQPATIRLFDVTGRLMHQETVRLYSGSNQLHLVPAKTLPAGIYQLSVAEFGLSQKLVIK